jgi:aryl-alcohol dehydrogenase
VLSYQACGQCRPCRTGNPAYCEQSFRLNFGGARADGSNALSRDGVAVHGHFFGQSSFATYAIAGERNAVKVDSDLPAELVAPLGCGLQTGAGAVLNSLKVPAGAAVAVFGTGTVGLAAVMAARAVSAAPIIAVDINADRLALARELGATHVIDGRTEDVLARVLEITGSGADFVLEVTGRPRMLSIAVQALAPLGVAAQIGGAPAGVAAEVDMNALLGGRTVRGIAQGDSVPQVFIPQLIRLYREGRFPFDRLLRTYDFDQINEAIEDTVKGTTIKPVLRMPR